MRWILFLLISTFIDFTPLTLHAAIPVIRRNFSVQGIAPPADPLPSEEASAGTTRYSFIVYGDTRGGRDGKEIQYEHSVVVNSMLETIKKAKTGPFPVRFVLQSGDAVVNGKDPRQWNVSFVQVINRLTQEAGVSYFLAPGNHDVTASASLRDPGRRNGLSNYLAAVGPLIPENGSARRLAGYPTYAFAYGNSFFIGMDSNIAGDPLQEGWVEGQLKGVDRTRYSHIFVFFHHPPFSSGNHGGAVLEIPSQLLRQHYMPMFRKYHVSALLTGHEHLFEHWVERYESRGATNRMDILITGGGGAPLHAYKGEPDLRDYLKSYSAEKVSLEHLVRPGPNPGDNPHHYVVVKVDGKSLSVDVIGVGWGTNFQPYRSRSVELQR